jgi:lipoate-protein ligase A
MWFIDDIERAGVVNMAIDDIFARKIKDIGVSLVMRLYRWDSPTLSCGFHQKPEDRIDFDNCRSYGVLLVRRPTGGRELLHDGDLSFCLTAKAEYKSTEAVKRSKQFFFKVGQVIIGGLNAIGIKADIESGSKKNRSGDLSPCLAVTSQYEITVDGKKLVPMAQRLYSDSIMVHGSIPIDNPGIPTARLIKTKDADRLQDLIDKTTCNLYRLRGKEVDMDRLKSGMLKKFEEVFNGRAECISLPERILAEVENSVSNWEIK